ncbi:Lachesin-like 11 [Homarus americanus]|uniref:Lachesin-like 11 n=1 Tax=Homarus americanus TaxID=6706 RepID=A0A8J5N8D2_HOMAM|nr:Lachesin-like 11 [Homarus americanus]
MNIPLITVPNQLVGAPVGTSVTLECQVDAFPNAVHFWRFNNQLLINSTRQETHEIRQDYTTTMKLSLRSLRHKDFGSYVCGAKNSLGETDSNVRLYVLRPEQHNEDHIIDSWHRQELDSDSPGYTLEENAFMRGGVHGSSLGGTGPLDGLGSGTSGRTSMGATTSSSPALPRHTIGGVWAGVWCSCCFATLRLGVSTMGSARLWASVGLLLLFLLHETATHVFIFSRLGTVGSALTHAQTHT